MTIIPVLHYLQVFIVTTNTSLFTDGIHNTNTSLFTGGIVTKI